MGIESMPIVIVGCGPGAPEYLSAAGLAAIDLAEVLVGAPRLLEWFPSNRAERIPVGSDISLVLAMMEAHAGQRRIVVLVTGDPGLYSLAQPVIRRFGRKACHVIPGISSVQMAFARVGVGWDDACILSLHGQVPAADPASFIAHKKIAILTGGKASRPWLQALGGALGQRYRAYICSDLTLEHERVDCVQPAELAAVPLPSRTVVLFIEEECLR